MKKTIFFLLANIAVLAVFTACGPETRLDIVGMFVGTSPNIDDRFTESQEYNNTHGFAIVKSAVEDYRVYVCTDTHVANTQVRWTQFVESYRKDLLCPVAIHLGDLIDAQNHYDEFYNAYKAVPENPIKPDTLMVVTGNHDIYFKQWPQFIEFFKTCTYYFIVETPSGKKDLYICYDTANGTVGNKQLDWLRATLEWADKQDFRHIVTCTHTHIFKRDGSQGHCSNFSIEETYSLLNLFTKHGVEMMWNGHDHCREITEVKGMTSIVVNSLTDEDTHPYYMVVTMGKEIDYEFVEVP